jgi:hypothetical protein
MYNLPKENMQMVIDIENQKFYIIVFNILSLQIVFFVRYYIKIYT